MTDWRDIVDMIESFATVFHNRHRDATVKTNEGYPPVPAAINPPITPRRSTSTTRDQQGQDDKLRGYTGDLQGNVASESSTNGKAGPVDGGRTLARTWDQIWPVAS